MNQSVRLAFLEIFFFNKNFESINYLPNRYHARFGIPLLFDVEF